MIILVTSCLNIFIPVLQIWTLNLIPLPRTWLAVLVGAAYGHKRWRQRQHQEGQQTLVGQRHAPLWMHFSPFGDFRSKTAGISWKHQNIFGFDSC